MNLDRVGSALVVILGMLAISAAAAGMDTDATNAVYRSWLELANDVDDADRRIHTPSEVATRAVENGFDRQAVQTLTNLFEAVRYGQHPPTSDRESRAESALDSLRTEREGA